MRGATPPASSSCHCSPSRPAPPLLAARPLCRHTTGKAQLMTVAQSMGIGMGRRVGRGQRRLTFVKWPLANWSASSSLVQNQPRGVSPYTLETSRNPESLLKEEGNG